MDRMGVMFNRTPEGLLDFRRFGGTKYHRTAFAGATTGQQLLYALDEQVRRWETAGLVTKFEHWEFLGSVLDDENVCRGIAAQDLRSMEIKRSRLTLLFWQQAALVLSLVKRRTPSLTQVRQQVLFTNKALNMRMVK